MWGRAPDFAQISGLNERSNRQKPTWLSDMFEQLPKPLAAGEDARGETAGTVWTKFSRRQTLAGYMAAVRLLPAQGRLVSTPNRSLATAHHPQRSL